MSENVAVAVKDPGSVWVASRRTEDGRYEMVVDFDGDTWRTLTEPEALRYVRAVLAAAGYAEYDAAVLRQFTTRLGLDAPTAAYVV